MIHTGSKEKSNIDYYIRLSDERKFLNSLYGGFAEEFTAKKPHPDFSKGFYFGDFGEYYVAPGFYLPKPDRVIFNNKTTVVFWNDGTKTVVSCDDHDEFQEEFGFAMACMKKLFGTRANFKAQFEHAVHQKPKGEKKVVKKALSKNSGQMTTYVGIPDSEFQKVHRNRKRELGTHDQ